MRRNQLAKGRVGILIFALFPERFGAFERLGRRRQAQRCQDGPENDSAARH
jgi:hypothetical protein